MGGSSLLMASREISDCVPDLLPIHLSALLRITDADTDRRYGHDTGTNMGHGDVLAITVFFLLLPAFYAFLAPFLGKRIFEYASIAIYSPLVLVVFILYIRCARINPADPGVIAKFDDGIIGPPNNNPRFQSNSFESRRSGTPFSPSSSRRSPDGDNSRHSAGQDAMIDIDGDPPRKTLSTCQVMRGKVHAVFAKEDCRKDDIAERQAGEQDSLFCIWCKVEVRKYSKHCRNCDKCVDEFDHHCWWLGNCVGRKNYITFFSLILTSLVWFAVESGVGIAVLVLCFVDKKGKESNIVDKFGNGFSRAPFVTVVAVCTAVSFVASVLLGDLFIFHMILIKKGNHDLRACQAKESHERGTSGVSS